MFVSTFQWCSACEIKNHRGNSKEFHEFMDFLLFVFKTMGSLGKTMKRTANLMFSVSCSMVFVHFWLWKLAKSWKIEEAIRNP